MCQYVFTDDYESCLSDFFQHPRLFVLFQCKAFEQLCDQMPDRIDERLEWGWTVAHISAACGQEEILRIIARRNKSVLNMQNDSGVTPMHYAAANGQVCPAEFRIDL